MLVVETVVRIRREYAAGKPIKAICRELRLSRKVVRKAIRGEEGAFSYPRRETQPFPKLGPVRERLDQLLVENEARPRRDRLKLTRVWDLLVREGYDGSYCSGRRYAARWRLETKAAPGDGGRAFVPLMFLRIPRHRGRGFHGIMGTISTRWWARIPRHRGRPC